MSRSPRLLLLAAFISLGLGATAASADNLVHGVDVNLGPLPVTGEAKTSSAQFCALAKACKARQVARESAHQKRRERLAITNGSNHTTSL